MKVSFARGENWKEQLMQAYTFRYTQTPEFTQNDDHIATAVNPSHPEGYDNISLLTRETYGPGATATLHCSFEGVGCPEIIVVESPEECPDGAVRYGACFEVVLWKNGINQWRHYRDNGRCHWHKRMGLSYPVAEDTIHELTVQVKEKEMVMTLNGQQTVLYAEDIPSRFHLGITGCEGIARLYDFEVK